MKKVWDGSAKHPWPSAVQSKFTGEGKGQSSSQTRGRWEANTRLVSAHQTGLRGRSSHSTQLPFCRLAFCFVKSKSKPRQRSLPRSNRHGRPRHAEAKESAPQLSPTRPVHRIRSFKYFQSVHQFRRFPVFPTRNVTNGFLWCFIRCLRSRFQPCATSYRSRLIGCFPSRARTARPTSRLDQIPHRIQAIAETHRSVLCRQSTCGNPSIAGDKREKHPENSPSERSDRSELAKCPTAIRRARGRSPEATTPSVRDGDL